jgi:glycosyltransferase involved in cell wall biosynthesis
MIKIRNEGVIAKSRNIGIQNSTAPWIAFLDSDDFWETNKLSTIADIIWKCDPGLCYHGMRYVLNDIPGKRMKTRKLKRDAFKDLLINGNTIPNSSVVVKKGILYEVGLISESPDLIGTEDFNTWLKVTKAKFRIHYCNQTLGGYRLHENSFSSIAQKVLPSHATEAFRNDLPIRLKNRMDCNNSYLLGRHSMIQEDYAQAAKYLRTATSGARLSLRLKAVLFLTTISIRFLRLRMFRSN